MPYNGNLKDDGQAVEALCGICLPGGLRFLAGVFPMAVVGRWARLHSSLLSCAWPGHPWCSSGLLTWSLILLFCRSCLAESVFGRAASHLD